MSFVLIGLFISLLGLFLFSIISLPPSSWLTPDYTFSLFVLWLILMCISTVGFIIFDLSVYSVVILRDAIRARRVQRSNRSRRTRRR